MYLALGCALLLAACFVGPLDVTGRPCPCPDGWVCDPQTSTCARELTPSADAADCTLDTDDDGILECDDNCPGHDNPAQANEDGDARGDPCDVCPGDSDDGADGDGDLVGDACDPHPSEPRDHILLFEGFHEGLPAAWRVDSTWRVVDGAAVAESGAGVIANLTLDDPAPTGISYIVTRVTVGQIFDPVGSSNYVSLIRNFDPAPDSGVRCLVGNRSAMAPPGFSLRDTGAATPLVVETPYPFDVGMVERLVFRRELEAYECSNATLHLMGVSAVDSPVPHVGLRTRSAAASYDWMMIITSD